MVITTELEIPVPLADFTQGLLTWSRRYNRRCMPWKGEKDPYKIWLSEIMLQQTRVEQATDYYTRFLQNFPDITSLAKAPDDQVLKLWEGLGYYSRCRNLLHTARYIAFELNGRFPGTYSELIKLKGIGSYTAAAIASFAFNEPRAVLDGNVFRILSRISGVNTPINSPAGKKVFGELATRLLPGKKAGSFNQAIMDFGALVCKPQPECDACFFQQGCRAYLTNTVGKLPVKLKKPALTMRWFNYFIWKSAGCVAIQRRQPGDIWTGLYQPILVETGGHIQANLSQWAASHFHLPSVLIKPLSKTTQKLTHQHLQLSFFTVESDQRPNMEGLTWIPLSELKQYPFPKKIAEVMVKIA